MKNMGSMACALAVAGALLAGCGGGGTAASETSRQSSYEIAVGEPNPAAPNIAEFTNMARRSSCADIRNRLFVIDGSQVFWDRVGNCPDASYEQVLYGNQLSKLLCSHADSFGGPRTACQDETARKSFETILANLDKADLGLGSSHKVERVAMLPNVGAALPFTGIAASQFSGVKERRNLVVRDQDAFQKLWAEHAAGQASAPSMPKVDFTRQMVIGVFSTQLHDACYGLSIGSITADETKLVVEVDERQPRMGVMCAQVAINPMQLVTLERIDAGVEFVTKASVDQPFTVLAASANAKSAVDHDVVAKDAASFTRLWLELTGATTGMPKVDFDTSMVIGVFMGTRANGCYTTEVAALARTDRRLRVTRVDTVPDDKVICTQGLVAPAQLVVVERSDLPLDFTLRVQPPPSVLSTAIAVVYPNQ